MRTYPRLALNLVLRPVLGSLLGSVLSFVDVLV